MDLKKENGFENQSIQNKFENETIRHKIENNVEYIQFKRLLEYPEINHAYILKSFNRNFRVGKDFFNIENVKKDLVEVAQTIGMNYEGIVRPDFNHTNQVDTITKLDEKEKPNLKGVHFPETDGLITKEKNIVLMATNADCNLILIYDPVKKIIANVHARMERYFW